MWPHEKGVKRWNAALWKEFERGEELGIRTFKLRGGRPGVRSGWKRVAELSRGNTLEFHSKRNFIKRKMRKGKLIIATVVGGMNRPEGKGSAFSEKNNGVKSLAVKDAMLEGENYERERARWSQVDLGSWEEKASLATNFSFMAGGGDEDTRSDFFRRGNCQNRREEKKTL